MPPLYRLTLATCLSSALLIAPRPARAQDPTKACPWSSTFPPGEPELDAASLRTAIGAELGDDAVAADDPRAAGAVGTIRVSIDRRAHTLVVAYSGPTEHRPRHLPLATPRPASSTADAEESLCMTAHRLRLSCDHDAGMALKGWDSYLAAYPNGRFALEARYNRALALVRLDRRDDARAALAPFADGTYSAHRRRDARAPSGRMQPRP